VAGPRWQPKPLGFMPGSWVASNQSSGLMDVFVFMIQFDSGGLMD
jgi:hypothetical protein